MAALAFLVPSALHVSAPRRLRSSVILKPRRSRFKTQSITPNIDENGEGKVQIEVLFVINCEKIPENDSQLRNNTWKPVTDYKLVIDNLLYIIICNLEISSLITRG